LFFFFFLEVEVFIQKLSVMLRLVLRT